MEATALMESTRAMILTFSCICGAYSVGAIITMILVIVGQLRRNITGPDSDECISTAVAFWPVTLVLFALFKFEYAISRFMKRKSK